MPTGYTAGFYEDPENMTTAKYLARCARGMGACINQRDDSLDALPQREVEVRDCHINKLTEALQDLRGLVEMDASVLLEQARKEEQEAQERYEKALAEHLATKEAIEAAQADIEGLELPEGLKEFALDQLRISTEHDYPPTRPAQRSLAEWREMRFEAVLSEIEHHAKGACEERKQNQQASGWLADLWSVLDELEPDLEGSG